MGTIFHNCYSLSIGDYTKLFLTRENRRYRKGLKSPDLLSSSLTAAPVCGNIFKETRMHDIGNYGFSAQWHLEGRS